MRTSADPPTVASPDRRMAARPGRVVSDLAVDAPYPRDEEFRTSSVYNDYCRQTSAALHAAMDVRDHL